MKLVVDNVRVHHTEVVKDTLHAARIQHELEFLPTYSPHLNPNVDDDDDDSAVDMPCCLCSIPLTEPQKTMLHVQ